jgi:hypothetical protein
VDFTHELALRVWRTVVDPSGQWFHRPFSEGEESPSSRKEARYEAILYYLIQLSQQIISAT